MEMIRGCLDVRLSPEQNSRSLQTAAQINPVNAPRDAFEAAVDQRKLWAPGMTLTVSFLEGNPTVQKRVAHYAHLWEEYANIRFKFIDSTIADIRIAFRIGDGSWSMIGTDAHLIEKSEPTMNYGWLTPQTSDDEYRRVILHEFGHALGLIHEHQNPVHGIPWDINKAYAYYMRQGWSQAEVDQQVFAKYSRNHTQFTAFDPNSIMLYPIPNDITIGDFEIKWNTHLSATDKAFIRTVYPFS